MMVNKKMLEEYCEHDRVSRALKDLGRDHSNKFQSHKWLEESVQKRMIYYNIYWDLLSTKSNKKILDVGGGYCSLSKLLHLNNDYTLLDIMAHDGSKVFKLKRLINLVLGDWYDFITTDKHYDIVIANDIFPNVDQRLELFLDKFLPICDEIRLSLTYYNIPRFYEVKRINADEVFHYLAWSGETLKNVLKKYNIDVDLTDDSIFPNGRSVYIVKE